MVKYASLLVLLLCNSCSESSRHKLVQDANFKNCYRSTTAGSDVLLAINYNGDSITGNLTYAHKEKDKNVGTIIGAMKGDTLFAIYNYRSEGQSGIRDVAFLKDGDGFIEGNAIPDPKTGEPDFSDHGRITFADGLKLELTACQN